MAERKGHIVILVENLPVPFDRRVWMESTALTQAGYRYAWNVSEGFEGDKDDRGRRGHDGGWRYHDLPWRQQ